MTAGERRPEPLRPVDGVPPPHSLEAETAVLCACVLSVETLRRCAATVRPEHFFQGAHQRIFEAMLAVDAAGAPLDAVAVATELRARGRIEQIGGAAYVAELLADRFADSAKASHHARIVFDLWRAREAIRLCQAAVSRGYHALGDVQEFLASLERDVGQLAQATRGEAIRDNIDSLKALVRSVMADHTGPRGVTGIPTGFAGLDAITRGWHAAELTVVGARPGVGKTALLGQIASCISALDVGTGVVSLEVPRETLITRLVCGAASVDTNRFRGAELGADEVRRFMAACEAFGKLPLWIDDRQGLNIHAIREAAFRFLDCGIAKKKPLGALVVDYVQYIAATPERARAPVRDQIGQASRGLKALARELKIPVIAAVALNRQIEGRSGKVSRPRMSDIRDCGNIESDADNVFFIHRDASVDEDGREREVSSETDLIVEKQRNGPTGTVRLLFEKRFQRFRERDQW